MGYLFCGLACATAAAAVPLYRACRAELRAMQLAATMLRQAPAALLPPVVGALAQGLFAFLWLASAAYIASSGKLQLSEEGFVRDIVPSPLRGCQRPPPTSGSVKHDTR